jgi:hypothetical protein
MITEEIERDIKRLMPPYITVQASLQFTQGTIVIEGSVVLLSWVGGIAFAAAKEAVGQHLSTLIKASVQRVLGQILPTEGVNLNSLDVTATGQSDDDGAMFTPAGGEAPAARSRAMAYWPMGREMKLLIFITAATFLLELGRVLGPYITIGWKPAAEEAKTPTAITSAETESDRIKKMQQALKESGRYAGPVDGIMGRQTKAALESLQAARGLKVTGALDAETAKVLGIR